MSGGSDGTLIVWVINKGELGRVLKTIPVCACVLCVCVRVCVCVCVCVCKLIFGVDT